MDMNGIMNIFCSMGKFTPNQTEPYVGLINVASKDIFSRVREDVDLEEAAPRLNYVCAAEAFYRYCLIEYANAAGGKVRAGILSVESDTDGIIIRAKKIRDESLIAASDILTYDREFLFRQVI
ncbi:MAG: hypothetical protein FWH14_06455 [Oscillospiraceae bacterium]|nr:hypothetical protein [Oscillospiraceae bacterium]